MTERRYMGDSDSNMPHFAADPPTKTGYRCTRQERFTYRILVPINTPAKIIGHKGRGERAVQGVSPKALDVLARDHPPAVRLARATVLISQREPPMTSANG